MMSEAPIELFPELLAPGRHLNRRLYRQPKGTTPRFLDQTYPLSLSVRRSQFGPGALTGEARTIG